MTVCIFIKVSQIVFPSDYDTKKIVMQLSNMNIHVKHVQNKTDLRIIPSIESLDDLDKITHFFFNHTRKFIPEFNPGKNLKDL